MANKRYDQFSAGSPIGSNITLFADPATGALSKCTLSTLLALTTTPLTLEQQLALAGSPAIAYTFGTNPIIAATSFNMSSATTYWAAMYIPASTITGVIYALNTGGVFTGNNFNGFGLYSTSGINLTRIAITVNDANIWKGSSQALRQQAFTGTVSVTAGIYFIMALYCSSAQTTAPNMAAMTSNSLPWAVSPLTIHLRGFYASRTTLQTSDNVNSTNGSTTQQLFFGVY